MTNNEGTITSSETVIENPENIDLDSGQFDLTNIVRIPQCCFLPSQTLSQYRMWLEEKLYLEQQKETPSIDIKQVSQELQDAKQELKRRNLL
jgi:hypothetical protein